MDFSIYELDTPQIEIEGDSFPLDLSFDVVLRFFDLMDDEGIHPSVKMEIAFRMLVPDWETVNLDIAEKAVCIKDIVDTYIKVSEKEKEVDVGSLFLTEEEQEEIRQKFSRQLNAEKEQEPDKFFDFKQDAAIIYASFKQEYQIDLLQEKGKLGWLEFRALLMSMRDETRFKYVVGIRAAKLPSGKHAKEERERLLSLKQAFALRSSTEKKVQTMNNLFSKLKGMSRK